MACQFNHHTGIHQDIQFYIQFPDSCEAGSQRSKGYLAINEGEHISDHMLQLKFES
jgi:hypothetical protein